MSLECMPIISYVYIEIHIDIIYIHLLYYTILCYMIYILLICCTYTCVCACLSVLSLLIAMTLNEWMIGFQFNAWVYGSRNIFQRCVDFQHELRYVHEFIHLSRPRDTMAMAHPLATQAARTSCSPALNLDSIVAANSGVLGGLRKEVPLIIVDRPEATLLVHGGRHLT